MARVLEPLQRAGVQARASLQAGQPRSYSSKGHLVDLENMSRREQSSKTCESARSWNKRDRLIFLVACAFVVLVVVVILVAGRGILAGVARRTAAGEMDVGAVVTAQKWLAWAAWLNPDDGRTELMRATCFRRLEHADRWFSAMELAKQKEAPSEPYEIEFRLGMIQSGTPFDGGGEEYWTAALLGAGVSPQEVHAAFVRRHLTLQQPRQAKALIAQRSADHPDDAHMACMTGGYWRTLGEFEQAEREFRSALTRNARHESARAALADLLEKMNRLDEALDLYVELATLSGGADTAAVSVARVLRKLGYVDEARAELEWLASQSEPAFGLAEEMGQLELASGDYEAAQRWFERAGINEMTDCNATLRRRDVVTRAAIAFTLDDKPIRAEELLDRLDEGSWRSGRSYDLRVRLAINPGDRDAASELERLRSPPAGTPAGANEAGTSRAPEDRRQNAVTGDLYARHCAACHGAEGGGDGRAARHLFPRARDLRTGKFRMVSTRNRVPTLEDLELVLEQGMSGTSMRPFESLSRDDRKLLAQEVLRLNRDGLREQFIDALENEGEEIDAEEVREIVDFCTTPGEVAPVPRVGPADSQAISRGKDTYFRLGCDNCHGEDGAGAGDTLLLDEKGRPSPPRDLAHEPFKGGHESKSVYQRVLLGMPGTPHPACPNVAQEQLVDLVHYCRWLSQEPKRTRTNHQRTIQATGGACAAASGVGAAAGSHAGQGLLHFVDHQNGRLHGVGNAEALSDVLLRLPD